MFLEATGTEQARPRGVNQGTILVVDDEPGIRVLLREILELQDYSVIDAEHGQAALQMLQNRPLPLLMITDLMMPVIDGHSLVRRVREDPELAALPIVVLSASAGPTAGFDTSNLVDAMIEKPFSPRALVTILRSIVSSGRATGRLLGR